MSLLQAYLSKPSTKRILNRRRNDQGFSLIELVVVVAVLAILSAIAVPAFMGMQEQAADSAARANLKNAYKECAYQSARGIANDGVAISSSNNPTYDFPQNDQFFTYTQAAGTDGDCSTTTESTTDGVTTTTVAFNSLTASKTAGTDSGKTLIIDLQGGDRTGTGTW